MFFESLVSFLIFSGKCTWVSMAQFGGLGWVCVKIVFLPAKIILLSLSRGLNGITYGLDRVQF